MEEGWKEEYCMGRWEREERWLRILGREGTGRGEEKGIEEERGEEEGEENGRRGEGGDEYGKGGREEE